MSSMNDTAETTTTTTTTTTTATSDMMMKKKTVYLIRHAESEENRRLAALSRTVRTVGTFSFPKLSDVKASTQLLNVSAQVDSDVSPAGQQQIDHMATKLKAANFLEANNIQLIAHSPLVRAKQTCEGMLGVTSSPGGGGGGDDDDDDIDDDVDPSERRVVMTELLLEKTPAEWTPLYYGSFQQRIRDLECWLASDQHDDVQNICLVGHSQFFKAMLQLDFKFGNCDVWKVNFHPSKMTTMDVGTGTGTGTNSPRSTGTADEKQDSTDSGCQLPPQWSNLQQVFHCDVGSSSKTP